jgi:hypothetical protein
MAERRQARPERKADHAGAQGEPTPERGQTMPALANVRRRAAAGACFESHLAVALS